MKNNLRTSVTVAILAVIGGIGAVNAQSSNAATAAWPPGPTGQGGTTTTSNVNVVNIPVVTVGNTPSVLVGNDVTIKDVKTPVGFQLDATFQVGVDYVTSKTFNVPAGQRLTIENASFYCNGIATYVHASLRGSDLLGGANFMSGAPVLWDQYGTYRAVGSAPLHVSSDGPLVFFAFGRGTTTGVTGCWGSVLGYLTPIP